MTTTVRRFGGSAFPPGTGAIVTEAPDGTVTTRYVGVTVEEMRPAREDKSGR